MSFVEKPEQDEGYLIVLKPEYVIQRFEKKEKNRQHFEEFQKFRKVYSSINPRKYRGISREVFEPYACFDKKVLERNEKDDITDCKLARLRMGEIQKGIIEVSCKWQGELLDESLLHSYNDVIDILSYIKNKSFFEIIFICKKNFKITANTLGFDIGYLGDGHFSIIADISVTPKWHPSNPADDQEILSRYFNSLNEHVLFNSVEEGQDFLDFYRTKPWAETEAEEGEFYVIQVDKVAIE